MAVQKDEKRTDGDTVDPDMDHGYAWVILAGISISVMSAR
jgi:hypothetical protein